MARQFYLKLGVQALLLVIMSAAVFSVPDIAVKPPPRWVGTMGAVFVCLGAFIGLGFRYTIDYYLRDFPEPDERGMSR